MCNSLNVMNVMCGKVVCHMILLTDLHTVNTGVCVITQVGVSALMMAAMKGKTEVVVELVKAGANVDMKNKVCQ